jgi:hypothetical protein
MIGGDVTVTVLGVNGNQVRIAPANSSSERVTKCRGYERDNHSGTLEYGRHDSDY